MKKGDIYKLVIIALAITAVVTVILVTVSILEPGKRSSKAQKYNLDCSTQLKKNPLKECKSE